VRKVWIKIWISDRIFVSVIGSTVWLVSEFVMVNVGVVVMLDLGLKKIGWR